MTSPILNTLPSITQIVSLIPAGANPYTFGLNLVESSAFPSVEKRTYTILIVLSAIHACTIIFCGAVITIPCWRRRERGKNMIWLLKKFYVNESRKVYWIPNTSLTVAICQLLTSCFCEIYTYVDYASLKSPEFAGKMSLGVCVQFMWLFNFYSYFVTSWGALNTCLCSPHPSSVLNKRLLSNPAIIYASCTLVPIIVTVITLTWSIVLAIAYHNEMNHITRVRALLIDASHRWETKEMSPPNEFMDIVLAGDSLLKATSRLISCLKWNSFTWAALWSITGLFYTYSVWPLVKLMEKCSQRMTHVQGLKRSGSPRPELPPNPFVLPQTPSTPSPDRPLSRNTKGVGKALRRGYIFLICHCTVMTISMIYTLAVSIVIGTHTEKVIVVAQWRSLGSWLYLVSGGFSAIAMLFQSWRSYSEINMNDKKSSSLRTTNNSDSVDSFKRSLSWKLVRKTSIARSIFDSSTTTGSSIITSPPTPMISKTVTWNDEVLIIKNPVYQLDYVPPGHDLEILRFDDEVLGSEHSGSFKSFSPLLP